MRSRVAARQPCAAAERAFHQHRSASILVCGVLGARADPVAGAAYGRAVALPLERSVVIAAHAQLADDVGEEGGRRDGLAQGLSVCWAFLGFLDTVAAERVTVGACRYGVIDDAGAYAAQEPCVGRLQEELLVEPHRRRQKTVGGRRARARTENKTTLDGSPPTRLAPPMGEVKLSLGLDDFISPSAACVKPIKAKKQAGRGHAVLRLEGADGAEDGEDDRAAVARITLNDCLACSGCITSSESVLITQQSSAEFLRRLQSPSTRLNLVVISPAARAAIATHVGLSLRETQGRLAGFLQGLGAHALLDCGLATDLHLVQVAAEFVARYRAAHPLARSAAAPCDCGGGGAPGPLPVLSSSCPGWVCYAEKTQGAAVLPYLSTVKSPQQIMGTLLKYAYAPTLGLKPQVAPLL
jgi:hypothetical protein